MFWDGDVLNYDPKLSVFDELEIRQEGKEDYGWMDGWMDGWME